MVDNIERRSVCFCLLREMSLFCPWVPHPNPWNKGARLFRKLDRVDLLMTNPPSAKSTTDTYTHPLSHGEASLVSCIDKRRSFITRQNHPKDLLSFQSFGICFLYNMKFCTSSVLSSFFFSDWKHMVHFEVVMATYRLNTDLQNVIYFTLPKF